MSLVISHVPLNINKAASLACAVRLADTISVGGAFWAPRLTMINYMIDNISKYMSYSYNRYHSKITKYPKQFTIDIKFD